MSVIGSRSLLIGAVLRTWCKAQLRRINTTRRNRRDEHCTKNMFPGTEPAKTFKFTDYDCIGFDLDNTLSRYKVGAMIEMEYEVMAKFLVEKKGYSTEHLLKPFDHNFILRGLMVDDENGNIIRIAPDGYILQASHGTRMLQPEEIENYYPKRHWEPSDIFVRDPLTTWNGPYSEKMRTLLDYFDIAASLLFARAVDAIDEQQGNKQSKYSVWLDIQEALQDMFNRENFQTGVGGYFNEIKTKPDKYYYRCSDQLINWLNDLKAQKKLLFLLTGSNVDFASHTASNTIGPNWREFFSIVVCYSKKPGFFTMKRPFLTIKGAQEESPITMDQLQMGGIYSQGNWTDMHQFLSKHLPMENPKFLYIGDNLIQDVFTPNVHSHCDTVTVCEELEAEGAHGFEQWHPDQQFLISTVWGSYFKCNTVNTNWYHLMTKHSKLCIPSIEYVAGLPIDYEFPSNDSN